VPLLVFKKPTSLFDWRWMDMYTPAPKSIVAVVYDVDASVCIWIPYGKFLAVMLAHTVDNASKKFTGLRATGILAMLGARSS
jgi:hypothetical protein